MNMMKRPGSRRRFATCFVVSAAVFCLSQPAVRAAFFWTNNVSGNWSSGGNWTNDSGVVGAPAAAGETNGVLNFNVAGTYAATNDLNSGFLLNQLNFGGATVTLAGNGLAFTNNGAALPQINQNGSVNVNITNNLVLGANLTVGGSGSGQVFLNGVISGAGAFVKNGGHKLTLNNVTNTYSGGTTIHSGTVSFVASSASVTPFFGTGPVTVNSAATLAVNRTSLTNAITFNGGTVSGGNSFSSNLKGPITLAASPTFSFTGGITLSGNMSGPGGFIKTGGTGVTMPVSGTNTFTGPVFVNAGAISVASFNSVSGGKPASHLGAPASAANGTISLGATATAGALTYTGPGETTDRVLQMSGTTGGATITQQGTPAGVPITQTGQSGLLKFTGHLSVPGTAGADNRKTLTLTSAASSSGPGFIVGQGEISGSIGDSVLGNAGQRATSVTKAGYGVWTLSGSNTYSGTTAVQAGKLVCTHSTALGGGPLTITDSDVASQLELVFLGSRQVASLTLNGAVQPNGAYGSSDSVAATKDDTHFAGPGVVLVGPVTGATTNTLALTGGTNPSAGGATLTFTATVTGGNSPGGDVVFYDGLTPLATNALNGSTQAAWSTGTLAGGVHTIAALYLGNASNAPSASASLSQTVNESRPATSTALALAAGANPSSPGEPVTYNATVTGATPAGMVMFYDGTIPLGTVALNGSAQASLAIVNLTRGWHGITAKYLGDAGNAPSASAPQWHMVKPPAGNGKLKVFILAGQSNMQGKGQVEQGRDPDNLNGATIAGGLGSLRNMLNSNTNKHGYLVDTNTLTNTTVPGWRTLTNVWVSYFTSGATASATQARKGYLDADFGDGSRQGRIGPEYGFGLVVGSQLGDPVLIIKTAWGGNSLTGNFRPPSSGGTVGDAYTYMVANVHYILNNLGSELTNFNYNASAGYEIAGFGWHQGWNDIGEPQLQYETNLVNLIRDLRVEFGAPNMPAVIDTTGMASAGGNQLLICAAQAAVANPVLHPELAGTVFTVDTRPFDYGLLLGVNSQGYHWYFNGQSQFNIGQSMGMAMMSLLSSPPGVVNMPVTGITATSAVLNVTVAWPYTPCLLKACWDTVDGGTNAAAWTHSTAVASWSNSTATNRYGVPGDCVLAGGAPASVVSTNLSFIATGLTPDTTYYVAFRATNTVSDLWATNVLSFKTLALDSPTITNTAAGGLTTTSAVINATLNGPTTECNVSAYWNTVTGGTNAAAWTNSAHVGTWTNVTATNVSCTAVGLTPGQTYYFTFRATNTTHDVWAANVLSFTTLTTPPPMPTFSGDGVIVTTNALLSVTFPTTAGYKYRLAYKDRMTDASWQGVIAPPAFPAPDGWSDTSTGAAMTIADPGPMGPTRFYRLETAVP